MSHAQGRKRPSMEGTRNGGDLGLWSRYRDHTTRGSRSTSSSGNTSAGTIVSISTGYTSNSSRLSPVSSPGLEAARHLDLDNLDEERSPPTKKSRKEIENNAEQQKEEMYYYQELAKDEREEIKILIQEFLGAPSPPPSFVDCSSLKFIGGNIGVLDRWLKHLGVGWVLDITDDYVSAGKLELTFDDHAWSWTRALPKITRAIQFMASSLCSGGHGHNPSSSDEGERQPETETGNKDSIPDLFQFAQFIKQTMLKLFVFVDVIVDVMNRRVRRTVLADLSALLSVHDALSVALLEIRWQFGSPPSRGVETIQDTIHRILSAKQAKAAEAIWRTMKQILIKLAKDQDKLSCSLDTEASSDVHKATQFAVSYIRLLCVHHQSVAPVVSEAASLGKYVPQTGNIRPLDSMVTEIVSCLQEILANTSQFFLDRGLGSLFLLNNLYFIIQELPYKHVSLKENMAALSGKVGDYVNSYLQVSWAPILSSLLNPTRLCFNRNCSLLPKFEDEFQKTYSTQKLWKVVPDPRLRTTLRQAIIEKIIPGYTKYIEENKSSTPKFSPQELKEMLEELFEGR